MSSDYAFAGVDDRQEIIAEMVSFGERLMSAGHLEGALKYFRRMVRIYPESHASYAYLGELYRMRGDAERARKCFERSLEIGPEDPSIVDELSRLRNPE